MKNCLIWFRNDLRLRDNPLIAHCIKHNLKVIPVYIADMTDSMGSASKWWLKESLSSLNKSLNGKLLIETTDKKHVLKNLCSEYKIDSIVWSARYASDEIIEDSDIEKYLLKQGYRVDIFHSSLLKNPETTLKKDGTPFKVYTPFYKQKYLDVKYQIHEYDFKKLQFIDNIKPSENIDTIFSKENWHNKFTDEWQPGESGAVKKLNLFIKDGLNGYSEGRNRPDKRHTSMLSPHIRFGEISIRVIAKTLENNNSADAEIFYRELVWREFSYHLLFHFPHIVNINLQKKFETFPWINDKNHLHKWQKGLTGYPIVDAGMRQLWQTGYMHNRVRMIVGSFLVKNLLIHWKFGQEWFWDTLVDADIASNSASWQWVAGTGADAAPYFRIFNPVTQSKKFDPDGDYIRKYVPELKNIPNKYIHLPGELDDKSLIEYGVKLGSDYPYPIVDLSITRERALSAFKKLSKSTS